VDGNAKKGQYPHGKLLGQLKEFLLHRDTLQQWSGFSLSHRCNILAIEKQVFIHPVTLMRFYKRNGVKYYSLGFRYNKYLKEPDKKMEEIKEFCKKLADVIYR